MRQALVIVALFGAAMAVKLQLQIPQGAEHYFDKGKTEISETIKAEFARYVSEKNLNFPDQESYNKRLAIFAKNVEKNKKFNKEGHGYFKGNNDFTEMDDDERAQYQGLRGNGTEEEGSLAPETELDQL